MGEASRSFGRGLAAAGEGVAKLMEMQEGVVARGEAAALRDEVQKVADNARLQMEQGGDIDNWEESWQQTVAPMVEPLLQKIPERRRDHAVQVVRETLQQASLEAQRKYEVGRLTQARQQWEARVTDAVQRGDSKTAVSRLEEGRDVFVPEGEMENRRKSVESGCCAAAWRSRLQEDPVGALTAWRREDAPRPEAEPDLRAVKEEVAASGLSLRRRLGGEFAATVLQGLPPTPEAVKGARAAGLLESPDKEESEHPLSSRTEAEWMRRMDDMEGDEDSVAAMQLKLATLPVPVPQRRSLMRYLEQSRSLPQDARRDVSGELWKLFRKGAFGCAEDAVPQQRLCRLLRESRRLLAEGDADATTAWLNSLQPKETPWLCFEA